MYMKKLRMISLAAGLICGCVAAHAATTNDIWVYLNGQYYQCSMNANGTTNNIEDLSCKSAVDSYKTSLKTCADYYSNSMLRTFSNDCILPITTDFKENGKKECLFEAKTVCLSICLEKYKNSRLISYQDCNSYCSA